MENFQNLSIQLLLNLFLSLASGGTNLVTSRFSKSKTCNLQIQVDNGCAEIQTGVKSLVECTALCRSGCIGVIRPNPETCYHIICDQTVQCSSSNPQIDWYRRKPIDWYLGYPCQHNGIWNKTQDMCQCVDGWVGNSCERRPTNCQELKDYGYPIRWHWTELNISTYTTTVLVRCDLYKDAYNTMLMSSYGTQNNNKTWAEYMNGYFYDNNNFWIGLEKMKALNDVSYDLLYLSVNFHDFNNQFALFERVYKEFKLEEAKPGFKFKFKDTWTQEPMPYSPFMTLGDCLKPVTGKKFSTWDQDNDEEKSENCAAQAGVGWWFEKKCNMVCNPLGWSYQTKPGPETMSHVKMEGIDLRTHAKESQVVMYFHTYNP